MFRRNHSVRLVCHGAHDLRRTKRRNFRRLTKRGHPRYPSLVQTPLFVVAWIESTSFFNQDREQASTNFSSMAHLANNLQQTLIIKTHHPSIRDCPPVFFKKSTFTNTQKLSQHRDVIDCRIKDVEVLSRTSILGGPFADGVPLTGSGAIRPATLVPAWNSVSSEH